MGRCLFGVAVFLSGCGVVLAHQPTISDGTATTPENAIAFDDIQLSRVVYHEMTAEVQQLWLTFDIAQPQSLFVTIGVPSIMQLESYRPAFAILGPGLPDIDLRLDVSVSTTGLLFVTDDVTEPEVFHEPFSGTTSWILREEDVELPVAGTYYIVVYVPSGESGKVWIAPGNREEFTLGDILELGGVIGEVQAFHEVMPGGFPCFLIPTASIAAILPMLWLIRKKLVPPYYTDRSRT